MVSPLRPPDKEIFRGPTRNGGVRSLWWQGKKNPPCLGQGGSSCRSLIPLSPNNRHTGRGFGLGGRLNKFLERKWFDVVANDAPLPVTLALRTLKDGNGGRWSEAAPGLSIATGEQASRPTTT